MMYLHAFLYHKPRFYEQYRATLQYRYLRNYPQMSYEAYNLVYNLRHQSHRFVNQHYYPQNQTDINQLQYYSQTLKYLQVH